MRAIALGVRLETELFRMEPELCWQRPYGHRGAVFFRIVDGPYNPLSVAGSLSSGGRFNVGGAQARQEFPQLRKAAGLYDARIGTG